MGMIYKITNKVNRKAYIGYTVTSLADRFDTHVKDSKKYKNRPLYRAFAKYGINNFTIELLEEVPDFQLKIKEKICIQAFGTYTKGYNATLGGDGRFTVNNKYEIYQWYVTNNATVADTATHFSVDRKTVKSILKTYKCTDIRNKTVNYATLEVAVHQFTKTGEYVNTYSSATKASESVYKDKSGRTHITRCCKNKCKSAFGFVWRYVN